MLMSCIYLFISYLNIKFDISTVSGRARHYTGWGWRVDFCLLISHKITKIIYFSLALISCTIISNCWDQSTFLCPNFPFKIIESLKVQC